MTSGEAHYFIVESSERLIAASRNLSPALRRTIRSALAREDFSAYCALNDIHMEDLAKALDTLDNLGPPPSGASVNRLPPASVPYGQIPSWLAQTATLRHGRAQLQGQPRALALVDWIVKSLEGTSVDEPGNSEPPRRRASRPF